MLPIGVLIMVALGLGGWRGLYRISSTLLRCHGGTYWPEREEG